MPTAAAIDAFLVSLQANMTAVGLADDHDLAKLVGAVRKTIDHYPITAPVAYGLLTIQEVAALTKLSVRQINRLHSAGRMPNKITDLGEKSPRFKTEEILAWVARRCRK